MSWLTRTPSRNKRALRFGTQQILVWVLEQLLSGNFQKFVSLNSALFISRLILTANIPGLWWLEMVHKVLNIINNGIFITVTEEGRVLLGWQWTNVALIFAVIGLWLLKGRYPTLKMVTSAEHTHRDKNVTLLLLVNVAHFWGLISFKVIHKLSFIHSCHSTAFLRTVCLSLDHAVCWHPIHLCAALSCPIYPPSPFIIAPQNSTSDCF